MTRGAMNRIAEMLLLRGMTQKELALAANITESAISHYVKGDRVPRGVNLIKIAKALGTTTDYLLNQDELMKHENDLEIVKTLIARNAEAMTKDQKMELVSILFDGSK